MARISRRTALIGMGALTLTGCASGGAVSRADTPTLIPHGGGMMDQRYGDMVAQLAGGKGAPILISPYSGNPAQTGRSDVAFLRRFGLRNTEVLNLSDRDAALAQVAAASAIWFSGGVQGRQVARLTAVPGMRDAMQQAHRSGTVMAGGSAGAAVMSSLMISGGRNGTVYTRTGLGFWPEVVLDQHVSERNRQYRLRRVIANNPRLIGIGLDEATWVVHRAGRITVHGRGRARIVKSGPGGVSEEALRPGQRYDLAARALA